jgi:predicted DNA-binding protein (UPF0251 family)
MKGEYIVARPKKRRIICAYPGIMGFTPYGDSAGSVDISFDEYEAFRLIDKMQYTQEECAKQMNVARSTVTAIYESARAKIADAVVSGKAINIHGGDVELCRYRSVCCGQCGKENCGQCSKCDKEETA